MNDSFTYHRSVARQGKGVMFAVRIDEARRHRSTSVFFDPHCPLNVCAVTKRRFPVGASPTRQSLQPEATGAVMDTRVTRFPRYYEPLRHPRAPGLSLTGVRLVLSSLT